ncbi:MAG: hypothetical protein MJ007_05595 [Paludibacteraceae bacterium]|nr:hypothetical protein [Paludibacteraceae bacterium]
MTKNIIDIRALVYRSLQNRNLGRALAQLMVIGNSHTEKIQNLQDTYRTLLSYYIDGTDDPDRSEIVDYLIRETYELTDIICTGYIPSLYCEDDIFKQLALTILYSDSTLAYAHSILDSKDELKGCLAASAILLSCLNVFQEEKLLLLIDYCGSEVNSVMLRALTGVIICLIYHNERLIHYPKVNNRLNILFDNEDNVSLSQTIIKDLIRCTETERISDEINNNILPSISKIAPELDKDKDTDSDNKDIESRIYEINDKLEDMGIADKMRTYAQLQAEGADINISTFRQLKNFPFFSNTENWFMPFYKENANVADIFENTDGKKNMFDLLLKSNTLCDSDKYSLCMNIKSVSSGIRATIFDGFKEESEDLEEHLSEITDFSKDKYVNHYLHDFYRFIKLHKDHRYFKDIFASTLDIHNMAFFRFINPNNDFLPELAAFYLNKQLYGNSLDAYLKLLATDSSNIQYYKAIGNCYIKLKDYSNACVYYKKADIINSDEESVIKKLALCYRKTGNFKEAEKLYTSLSATDDKNLSYLYNLAICQVEKGDYKQALNNLYKLRFMDEDVKLSPEYNLYLGICLWSEGKKKEAVGTLRNYNPLHELEKALKESSYPFSNEEVNFIIDYLRLN